MALIVKSFILSFGVFGRMILPVLAIVVVSSIASSILNMISGGYASYVSGPITATFASLFGIRVALSLLGDHRRTGYDVLMLYAVLYGVFFLVAKGGALMFSDVAAALYADWQLGDAVSLRSFVNADRSLQFAFAVHALGAKAILSLAMYTMVYAVMAVPLASAARAAGHGALSAGFFNGFGKSFIPLFCIFSVSFFLQFFFNLFTALFAIIPLFVSVLSIVISQSLPDFDLDVLWRGLAASAGLLWLNSWIWSASAVALEKSEQSAEQTGNSAGSPVAGSTVAAGPDLRALRKSRAHGSSKKRASDHLPG